MLAKVHGSRLAAKAPATRKGGSMTPLTSAPWASPMATSNVGETIRNMKQLRLADPHENSFKHAKTRGPPFLGPPSCVCCYSSRRLFQKTRKRSGGREANIYVRLLCLTSAACGINNRRIFERGDGWDMPPGEPRCDCCGMLCGVLVSII